MLCGVSYSDCVNFYVIHNDPLIIDKVIQGSDSGACEICISLFLQQRWP